jgi:hypothetical protein
MEIVVSSNDWLSIPYLHQLRGVTSRFPVIFFWCRPRMRRTASLACSRRAPGMPCSREFVQLPRSGRSTYTPRGSLQAPSLVALGFRQH